ncbi:MAG TPA: NUMOD3 domain-containing DNA-binding protein [Candidatus Paceibacterota bacterium]|nr:NUMOD3 domain-containing DNA-binding protein [Candidatus Paceibacterota bacterium]
MIHILLFEAFNNYKLTNDECVHHKDKNKINNKLENLQLMNKSDHNSLHHRNKILSEEHKRKLSSLNIGKNHPMFGKNHSEESKIKMSESKKEKYVGENNPSHILIKKDVIEIIKLCNEKILTQREIAKIYNVSYSTISAIKNKRIWIHIKEDLK